MPRALKVCTGRPGKRCAQLTDSGRCPDCRTAADRARGTSRERGYNTAGHRRFRAAVLRRDVFCVLGCGSLATVADHHPLSRRELVERGLNPNAPEHGRGLCAPCHGRETQANPDQRGGWNRR